MGDGREAIGEFFHALEAMHSKLCEEPWKKIVENRHK